MMKKVKGYGIGVWTMLSRSRRNFNLKNLRYLSYHPKRVGGSIHILGTLGLIKNKYISINIYIIMIYIYFYY